VRYASETAVPVMRSQAEIETLLERYGAAEFARGWTKGGALVGFVVQQRQVRFMLPLPQRENYKPGPTGENKWQQAMRQRWRALALIVKAKLEAVETGITTFEQEFLAHIVVPSTGRTVGEWLGPQLKEAYLKGKPPALLPGATTTEVEMRK